MSNNSKPRICAFAICATGAHYLKLRDNVVNQLHWYAPGVDVIDIDIDSAKQFLDGINTNDLATFSRLAIPLMDQFKKYERVIYIDIDVDIRSGMFASILDVDTSNDGLAAREDFDQQGSISRIKSYRSDWNHEKYFNAGVLVLDLDKINVDTWRSKVSEALGLHKKRPFRLKDQDVLNLCFEISEMDKRFNCLVKVEKQDKDTSWLWHYAGGRKPQLDFMHSVKNINVMQRCVVISPRHAYIRLWIRAYFASGNTIPLVIIPGPDGDWKPGDMEYCQKAASFSGGIILDCSSEWIEGKSCKSRAGLGGRNRGWYTKKLLLRSVAQRVNPLQWVWIDDDAEVTGNIDECFDYAESAPGFVCAQFYNPNSKDLQHPTHLERSRSSETGMKICWNSFVFFHGDANRRLVEDLPRSFPVEDDEVLFAELYQNDDLWNNGFCDFSHKNWMTTDRLRSVPKNWTGKIIHYWGAAKGVWSSRIESLPPAPFENDIPTMPKTQQVLPTRLPDDQAIDAVFVIGKGSQNNNEELRYALRNIAKHCPFVRDVYISGECPDWVDKSVVKHLQWPDKFRHAKDANIIDKLRHACEQKGIAKRILFCSDDQFQTHVCKWEDFFPRYLRPYTSEDKWYAERKRVWHTRLRNTLERDKKRREAAGLDTSHIFYFEPHIWMQIDRDKFIEYAKWSDYEHSADTIIASGYFNFVNAEGHPHDKKYDHVFMGDGTKTLPKVTHIAYTDEGYKQAMVFLKELFPDRCRFEVGGPTSAKTIAAAPAQAARAVKTSVVAAPTVVRNAETATAAPVVSINHAAIKAAIRSRIFGRISA